MQFVGIDLGTTNIRVSILDPEHSEIPHPMEIGEGDSSTMPSVVGFRREPNGAVSVIVGEDADGEKRGPNVVVVRNLKRYALSEDLYVRETLEIRSADWWQHDGWTWNQDSRSVEVFDQSFPVKGLLSKMLAEAFRRAGVKPGFDWTAGCPVHTGLLYRTELAQIITELGGKGPANAMRIVEEPVLFLTLAYKLGTLGAGSYLVYDLGGGSFDCALAHIDPANSRQPISVYGADGNPTLGGYIIDEKIAEYLDYTEERDGSLNQLRIAKESITPSNQEQQVPGSKPVTWQMVEMAVESERFKPQSFAALRASYAGAKTVWKRDAANGHEDLHVSEWNKDTGEVRFIWELAWDDMIADLDAILLCGGPTKSPLFKEALQERFGGLAVISADELFSRGIRNLETGAPAAELPPELIPRPELTAISAGACYQLAGEADSEDSDYAPAYVNRLPVKITLEDLATGNKVEYPPYQHLSSIRKPFDDFVSDGELSEQEDDPHSEARYELTVETPENAVEERLLVDPFINNRLIGSRLRLVVNHLGQVAVKQTATKVPEKEWPVLETPQWQTSLQLQVYAGIQDRKRIQAEEEAERIQRELEANRFSGLEPGHAAVR